MGPKLTKTQPPGSSTEYIVCKTAPGSAKMFERVEGNDDFYGIGEPGNELALGGDSDFLCLLLRKVQLLLSDFSFDSGQQNPQLAFSLVSFAVHCGRNAGSNQAQEVILKCGQHTGSP